MECATESSMETDAPCDCISFSDLPEGLLQHMLRLLDAAELAKLCVQDQRLRQLVSQQELWQKLALARWPHAACEQYGGDWQLLYRARVHLAPSFTGCVDRCHQLTARAAGPVALRINGSSLPVLASPAAGEGGPGSSPAGSPIKPNVYGLAQRPFASIPGMLYDQVMQMLFSLCCWQARMAASGSGVTRNLFGASASSSCGVVTSSDSQQAALAAELSLVRADMAWWLGSKPEAVFAFVRRTADMLAEYDMWGSGFTAWPEALWRRSALQFLSDLQLGPQAGVCPSVSERLGRELSRLDDVMRSVDAEASDLCTRPPAGLPPRHWWYGLRGQVAAPVC